MNHHPLILDAGSKAKITLLATKRRVKCLPEELREKLF